MRTIAIIGGGFCGTMVAVNLARIAEAPLRIILINSNRPMARGAAYSTRQPEHLLNVLAANMSAFPDHPSHFVDWLQTRSEYVDFPKSTLREMFIPRTIYGDYLCNLLFSYSRQIGDAGRVKIDIVEENAIDILDADEMGPTVILANGDRIVADQILLATGNQAPAPFHGPNETFTHPAYCPDPWSRWENALPDGGNIILLGTGLTMVDIFLSLNARAWKGNIIAISRHGRVPMSHFRFTDRSDDLIDPDDSPSLSVLLQIVKQHCLSMRKVGQNPTITINKLRPHIQRLWKGLSIADKEEFLKNYASQWNVVRHRIPESVHRQLSDAIANGRLRILQGTVVELRPRENGVAVVGLHEGTEFIQEGAYVINCTGPQSRISETADPLLSSLLRSGLARTDPLDLGIDISTKFAVIGQDGTESEFLFAIGPLLKGTLWETTAVPELRVQAFNVAQILAGSSCHSSIQISPQSISEAIEYYI
ncbi:MAG TPA: FAD/NAD(P)-binding protein [Planctomicrobium sp.]|nr:FAD/NAD(P)-binding protein [Planctomicrobium sp.]